RKYSKITEISENILSKITEWILNFKTERTGTKPKPNRNFKISEWILNFRTERIENRMDPTDNRTDNRKPRPTSS
ncbi:unnamed protein product, partial [Arabidopsis halleri]